jgi:flagellar basal-body rod modification protein FlgD
MIASNFPLLTTAAPISAGASASNNSATAAQNGLGPNAFITLLTAQLQSQDPLNPMDPNQMVSELTSMNTLQQIIQIRQDLDAMANPPSGSQGAPPAGGIAATHNLAPTLSKFTAPSPLLSAFQSQLS